MDDTKDRQSLCTAIKSRRRKLPDQARQPRVIFTENRIDHRMPEPQIDNWADIGQDLSTAQRNATG